LRSNSTSSIGIKNLPVCQKMKKYVDIGKTID